MGDGHQQQIEAAFDAYPRRDFLPADKQDFAGLDQPLAIGHEQTNSQPFTVRNMLGWLAVDQGDNVLDIGSGSGWTTALLSHQTGESGQVTAVERIPELVKFGRRNCKESGVSNASFHAALPDKLGWPENAPYQRILVSAAANSLPRELIDQLDAGGKLVIPIQHSIHEIVKHRDGDLETTQHPGYMFVPLL